MIDHGLTPETLSRITSVIRRFPDVERVVLYGSRAMGRAKPGSDIDLTLVGESLDVHALARIGTELDDLLLPYQIDLSIFAQIQNDDLIEHIERVGVQLFP